MPIDAKNFEDCVSQEISHLDDKYPDKAHSTIVGMAMNICRKLKKMSKADLVRFVELSSLLDQGSLDAFVKTAKDNFNRDDWIQYAVILRKEGMKVEEVAKMISYSPSWIKKYVTPKVEKATMNEIRSVDDEKRSLLLEAYQVPLIEFSIVSISKEDRIFEGWGSVQVKDSQNDVISVEGLEKIMPICMRRGGVIMFGHSNRHVGNLLRYKIRNKEVDGKSRPGVWLKGKIFSDYQIDDQAWEAIQLAKLTGQPVISLGATPVGQPTYECEDNECFRKINDLQVYEWSITALQHGSAGANPEATIERTIVKEGHSDLKAEDKAWVGGHLFSMKKQGTLPESSTELVDFMLSRCDSCQEDYLELTKAGLSDEEARLRIYTDLMKAMDEVEDDYESIELDNMQKAQTCENCQNRSFNTCTELYRHGKKVPYKNVPSDKPSRVSSATHAPTGWVHGDWTPKMTCIPLLGKNEWKQRTSKWADDSMKSSPDFGKGEPNDPKLFREHRELINIMNEYEVHMMNARNDKDRDLWRKKFEAARQKVRDFRAKHPEFNPFRKGDKMPDEEKEKLKDDEVEKQPPPEAPQGEQPPEWAQQIISLLQQLVSKGAAKADNEEEEEVPPPPEEEEEDEKSKETLTLSKFNLNPVQFEALAKSQGFVKSPSTPAPSVTNHKKDLVKGTEPKTDYPSREERLEALARGDLSSIAEKFKR